MDALKTRIETTHFQESLDFYTVQMNMNVIDSWDHDNDRGAILGFKSATAGKAFLEVGYNESPRQYEGLSLQFRVSSLIEVVKRLQGIVDFRGPVPRPWGSKYLYLRDPNGIEIIIYEGVI